MFTRKFALDLLERALKAAGWSLLATLGAGATGTLSGVDWLGAVNVAGYAFVIAALGGLLVGSQVGADNSASWLPESADPPAPRDGGHSDVVLLIAIAALVLVLLVIADVLP